MVRSILLRGFDQDMATRIGNYMENHGVKFIRGAVPSKLEKPTPEGRTIVSYQVGQETI
jgi:thioredoxin reductase (NADPH)